MRRSPLIACESPSADSRMNRFISAMPSSMCWPLGENSQLKVEGMRSLLKVSASASRANRLRRRHQPGMIVLVPGKRQPEAFDRVADEADRPLVIDLAERLDQRGQIMPREIGHQPRELVIGARLDQPRDVALVADFVEEPPAPGGAALEHERGVELVRAIIDPLAQALAARLAERLLQQRAVFENDHVPAEGLKQRLEARPQALADHRVEALAVVGDGPPAIAEGLLPSL